MDTTKSSMAARSAALPPWAGELIGLYESGAANQFILYGNVEDRLVLPLGARASLGSLHDFLLGVLLPGFDVILSFDLGNGLRVERGGEIFSTWPTARDKDLPRAPRAAIETITHYLRYCANLARLGRERTQVGIVVKGAQLVIPALSGGFNYDLSALAVQVRDWATDSALNEHPLATFLVTENLNDLHGLIANNPRCARINVPLPSPAELKDAFEVIAPRYQVALGQYTQDLHTPAAQLAGASLGAVESLLKRKEHAKQSLTTRDLVELKKELVEQDCNGLIEFIESTNTLDDLYGQERIKEWMRQDITLWQKGDLEAMPMGYLVCGPVGTGKTYLVKCLAGEAGVPVVKLKNFRDKWVGSTEGNLEKIFRLLHALGRCLVFVDEADQALGRRTASSTDSGLSGRIYSMIAEEMSQTRNRGKIVWILASSRPDLIEVDLKRPGRVDVKIPIFPTTEPAEGALLIRALCKRRGVIIEPAELESIEPLVPDLLTPGAAEALAVKVYRAWRTRDLSQLEALKDSLEDYQNPVPADVMAFQIRLAIDEATDLDFVPKTIRERFR